VLRVKLRRIGGLYGVDVPAAVSRAIGVRGRVPVVVRAKGRTPVRSTLMPKGGGRHVLFVNQETRGGARTGTIELDVRVDREPRTVATPEDLTAALDEAGVRAAWESMAPGKRDHIIRWIDAAVHEATREKRVARAVQEALVYHEKRVDAVD
jgi:hypothetical protein